MNSNFKTRAFYSGVFKRLTLFTRIHFFPQSIFESQSIKNQKVVTWF